MDIEEVCFNDIGLESSVSKVFERIKSVLDSDVEEEQKLNINETDELIKNWDSSTQHLKHIYGYYFELIENKEKSEEVF